MPPPEINPFAPSPHTPRCGGIYARTPSPEEDLLPMVKEEVPAELAEPPPKKKVNINLGILGIQDNVKSMYIECCEWAHMVIPRMLR